MSFHRMTPSGAASPRAAVRQARCAEVPAQRQWPGVHLPGPDPLAPRLWHGVSLHRSGLPWQNGYAESFTSRFRAELPDVTLFHNVADAQMQMAVWRRFYNEERPQMVLGRITPAAAAAQIRGSGRATPSLRPESAVSS